MLLWQQSLFQFKISENSDEHSVREKLDWLLKALSTVKQLWTKSRLRVDEAL